MIKAIIFDLWGVLAVKQGRLFDQLIAAYGLDETAHGYFVELLESMELGQLSEAEFWVKFSARCRLEPRAPKLAWLTLYQAIASINQVVLDLAARLRHSGYKIAILSNTDPIAVDYLRSLDVLNKFDTTVFSCDVGYLKPNTDIYRIALKSLDVQPAEAVFIDDNTTNVRAAQALGLHGIIFKDAEQLAADVTAILK